jgi:N-formylmaleamate deformylase
LAIRARERSPRRTAEMIGHLVDARLRTSLSAFEILAPPNPDFRELVPRFRVPTLLVLGERGVVSLETAKELQRLNSLVCLKLISDVGHGLPYDEPSRIGEVVLSFLRRHHPEIADENGDVC